jgi:nucleotide-binding universal stress UspA family protein
MRRVAEQDATTALERVAETLPPALRSRTVLLVTSGDAPERTVSEARRLEAELIVMGRSGGHELRDAVLGSTAERVVRRARLPVLVVADRPAKPYAKPLIALGQDTAAKHALRALLRLLPPPRPPLSVVHAYSGLLPKMTYPSLPHEVLIEYGASQRAEAERELERLLSSVKGPKSERVTWKPHVIPGSPRNAILETARRLRSDLLVVGTRGQSRATQLLLGSVSGDALRDAACDVLVVPPPTVG